MRRGRTWRGYLRFGGTWDRTLSTSVRLGLRLHWVQRLPSRIIGSVSHLQMASGGTLYCWGDSAVGQLGDGSTTGRHVPTLVSGSNTFAAVSTGYLHTCGLSTSDSLFCWGNSGAGQLGDGSTTPRHVPTLVSRNYAFTSVSAGHFHTCGVTTAGAHLCWRRNKCGQLGTGNTTNSGTPFPVAYW